MLMVIAVNNYHCSTKCGLALLCLILLFVMTPEKKKTTVYFIVTQ